MELNQNAAAKKRCQVLLAKEKEWLVTTGNQLGAKAKGQKDWGSQARVIWEAARKETEPLVLINLLLYQSARNDKSWQGVAGDLEKGIRDCIQRADGEGKEAALELIRHLLVYTIRAYTYEKSR